MANLLSRGAERRSFLALRVDEQQRLEGRLGSVVQLERVLARSGRPGETLLDHARDALELALDELESEPSLASLESLLDELARLRDAELRDRIGAPSTASPRLAAGGAWLCYRPGRSLGTGEAEIASRGFFDALDRPPLGLWLAALARPEAGGRASFEVAVLAWVPAEAEARARAGASACPSGALSWLEQASPELEAQLAPLLRQP